MKPSRHAASLLEVAFFAGLAAAVLGGVLALAGRGSSLVELGLRTSQSQTELRVLLETMAEDVNEIMYFGDTAPHDAGSDPDGFELVVRSAREEPGLDLPTAPTLRRVRYQVASGAEDEAGECLRTVAPLQGGDGRTSRRRIAGNVARLRLWPTAACRLEDGRYGLAAASASRARTPGAAPALLVVDVTLGERTGARSIGESSVTSIVTKLWCRDRLLELCRQELP